ncbi:MAG: NUDIX hydrolase [Rickettsiales bacterium]
MTSDIHTQIRDFLENTAITSMMEDEELYATENYLKAGVVPFVPGNPYRFYAMKPQNKVPSLGEPPFQICKGTRMHYVPDVGWKDIKEFKHRTDEVETLAQTAVRECIEELGLKMSNIVKLYNMGPYEFSSATTGRSRTMWLFASEIADQKNFLPTSEIAASTAERKWFSSEEFNVEGREDHRYILKDIETRLAAVYKE